MYEPVSSAYMFILWLIETHLLVVIIYLRDSGFSLFCLLSPYILSLPVLSEHASCATAPHSRLWGPVAMHLWWLSYMLNKASLDIGFVKYPLSLSLYIIYSVHAHGTPYQYVRQYCIIFSIIHCKLKIYVALYFFIFMQLTEQVRHQMETTVKQVYGVNLDDPWHRKVTESWDKAQMLVRLTQMLYVFFSTKTVIVVNQQWKNMCTCQTYHLITRIEWVTLSF